MSRGSFIVTQKENKGEYGSGWEWNNGTYDYNIYAHVIDQNGSKNSDGTPYRYLSHSSLGNNVCTDDSQTTHGSTIYSNINEQISCSPNTLNAGNHYSFPATAAGSDISSESKYPSDAKNSICPKGWRLPPSASTDTKSYDNLIRTVYKISDTASDANLISNSAMSFVRLGYYNHTTGSISARNGYGRYWSSTINSLTAGRTLYFRSGLIGTQNGDDKAAGLSIRCVSR